MCYKEQKVVDTLELQTFVIWLQKMIKHDIFYFTSLGSVHLLQHLTPFFPHISPDNAILLASPQPGQCPNYHHPQK